MTAPKFRLVATAKHCAVCGVEYVPRGPAQLICHQSDGDGKLTDCARVAQKIRWYRAALSPDVAAKYTMTVATVRARFDNLLARVYDPSAFVRATSPGRPRRRSLSNSVIIGATDEGEPIVATDSGEEVVARTCEVCCQLFDGPPGACGALECQRAKRKARNRDFHVANKKRRVASISAARALREKTPTISDPWTAPAPVWTGLLPGAVLPIDVSPSFTKSQKLGTALHAVLTKILREGQGHDPARPEWSLLLVGGQTSSGWAVWLPDEADVERVRGKTFDATVRSRACRLTFGRGATVRLKSPTITQTGRHRVRLTTITPVCMRALGADGHRYRSFPQTPTLWTALTIVAQRIGLALPDPTAIGVMRISHATTPERVVLNHGRGIVATAWSGDVVLDVNPLGRWLLEIATRIGVGGRTAFGLGRIAVRDEPSEMLTIAPSPEPWEVVVDQVSEKFGARMGITVDEARVALVSLVDVATYDGERANGYEAWRAGDVLLIAQPTTLRTLRVVDVHFDVNAPLVSDHAVDRFIEIVLGEGTCNHDVARAELTARVARSYPLSPYHGAMVADVPDAMLWVGPRTGDGKSTQLRFVVGTPRGATRTEVLTVLPLFDAPMSSNVISELWRRHAA